jgi:hypothetical protein
MGLGVFIYVCQFHEAMLFLNFPETRKLRSSTLFFLNSMMLCFDHSYAWFCSLTIQDLGRNARFAQIWKSRKGEKDEADESLREICHLYDAVQVDPDEEKNPAEPRQVLLSNYLPVLFNLKLYYCNLSHYSPCRITSFEEGAVLCNFLPLIREYLPSAAVEIESDIISWAQSEGMQASCLEMISTVVETFLLLSLVIKEVISICNSAGAEIVKVNSLAPALVMMSINFLTSIFRSL